jgi:hypothetical protein
MSSSMKAVAVLDVINPLLAILMQLIVFTKALYNFWPTNTAPNLPPTTMFWII